MEVNAISSSTLETVIASAPESLAGTGEVLAVIGLTELAHPCRCVLAGPAAEALGPLLSENRELETVTTAPAALSELELNGGADLLVLDLGTEPERADDHLEAALESYVFGKSAIVLLNTCDPLVRERLERMRLSGYPQVSFVDLDAVPGRVTEPDGVSSGVGILRVEAAGSPERSVRSSRATYDALVAGVAAAAPHPDLPAPPDTRVEALEHQLERTQRDLANALDELENTQYWLQTLKTSVSWRITAPLRGATGAIRKLLRRG